MTIKNYTFFSPTGTEFPVSATADRRLYLMLGGMNYGDYKMKHWVQPVNSGFNRIYQDTSFVVGGAYFELKEQAVVVLSNTNSYIHVNIDLSNLASPVFVTVETQDNSNNIDINSNSGILKKCIENVRTNTSSISNVTETSQDSNLIKQLKLAMNPVGTILTTTNSANPTTYIGGVWERYGKGRTLVSVDEEDSATLMKTAGNNGGSTNPLTSHAHDFDGRTNGESIVAGSTNNPDVKFQGAASGGGLKSSVHSHTFSGTTTTTGDNTDHNNWQPFVTVYFWRRTA